MQNGDSRAQREDAKQPYQRPELIKHGAVEEVTQGQPIGRTSDCVEIDV